MNPKWPIKQAGEQPSELENIIKGLHESHKQSMTEVKDLSHNVAALRSEFKNLYESNLVDLVNIQTSFADTFNAQGYRLNSLYVSDTTAADGAKLIVNYYGVEYTHTLQAGENELDIPNGATYKATTTSGNGFQAMLTRYNFRR